MEGIIIFGIAFISGYILGHRKGKTVEPRPDKGKIKVYATERGALYIKPEELFALPKVQEMIEKASKIKQL